MFTKIVFFFGVILGSFPVANAQSFKNLSLKEMILNNHFDTFKDISRNCLSDVAALYVNGGNLKTKFVKSNIRIIHPSLFDDNDLIFYHYTFAMDMKNIAINNDVFSIFNFIRKNRNTVDFKQLYVAEDANSSKDYGNIQIIVKIKPSTIVFDEIKSKCILMGQCDQIYNELLLKYGSIIESCKEHKEILNYLSLEEEGVGIIHYYSAEKYQHWYQITRPESIEQISLGTK